MSGITAKVKTLDDLRAELKFAESEAEEYGTLYNYWKGQISDLRRELDDAAWASRTPHRTTKETPHG